MSFPSLIKPPMWALSPGFVARRWQWFYGASLLVASPLWAGSGTVAQNLALGGPAGTFQGTPSWVGSSDGFALDFDGSSDYINFGDVDLSTNELSIIVRVKLPVLTSDQRIIAKWGTGTQDEEFVIWMDTGGSADGYAFQVKQNQFDNSTVGVNDATAIQNKWQTVIGNFTLDKMSIWTDGVEGESTNPSITSIQNTSRSINLARMDLATDQWMQGQCSLCVVRNKALSVNQIQQIFHDPFGAFRMADEVGVVIGLPAGVANPKGPFGMPFHGPFGGPI